MAVRGNVKLPAEGVDPHLLSIAASEKSVAFLARKLDRGGAERQLTALAIGLHRRGWTVSVILFYRGGDFETALRDAGIPVFYLEKAGRWDIWGFLKKLRGVVAQIQPKIVYSFLDVPNLAAATLFSHSTRVRFVWGIRAAHMDFSRYDWLTRNASRIESALSWVPNAIIANSFAGMSWAIQRGFPQEKLVVVENGIDTELFSNNHEGRLKNRETWGCVDTDLIVGVVARFDPMKGHEVFLSAISLIAGRYPQLRIVLIGSGPASFKATIESHATRLSLNDRLIWAGPHSSMPEAYSALDILCSPSVFGEGFPNVVAEAMACGVPCVVTDVGDSARIVGASGEIVIPESPRALADGLEKLIARLQAEGPQLATTARSRISKNFTLELLVHRTERILGNLE